MNWKHGGKGRLSEKEWTRSMAAKVVFLRMNELEEGEQKAFIWEGIYGKHGSKGRRSILRDGLAEKERMIQPTDIFTYNK